MNIYANGKLYVTYGDQAALVVDETARAEAATIDVLRRYENSEAPWQMNGQ